MSIGKTSKWGGGSSVLLILLSAIFFFSCHSATLSGIDIQYENRSEITDSQITLSPNALPISLRVFPVPSDAKFGEIIWEIKADGEGESVDAFGIEVSGDTKTVKISPKTPAAKARIKASLKSDASKFKELAIEILPKSIEIDASDDGQIPEITTGDDKALKLSMKPQSGKTIKAQGGYISSDSDLANVDDEGRITINNENGVNTGKLVTITVNYEDGTEYTISLVIGKAIIPQSMKVVGVDGEGNMLIAAGGESAIEVEYYDENDNKVNATYPGFTLSKADDADSIIKSFSNEKIAVSEAAAYEQSAMFTVTNDHDSNISQEFNVLIPGPRCLIFSSPSPFTLKTPEESKYWTGSLYVSNDNETWSADEWDGAEITSELGEDSKHYIYLRGKDFRATDNVFDEHDKKHLVLTSNDAESGKIDCAGDIRALINYEKPKSAVLTPCCFWYLFKNNSSLASAPQLLSTTLADSCYHAMFWGCSSLASAPSLPATALAKNCYNGMFYECAKLAEAPDLDATTLAEGCYSNMFANCAKLTTAPEELPATALAKDCYNSMFQGCAELKTAPRLPADTLEQKCYSYMFQNCAKLTGAPLLAAENLAYGCYSSMFSGCSSLTAAPALPATTLAKLCYYGMFQGCAKLQSAPALPANTLAEGCYERMFKSCEALETVPELPATALAKDCYSSMFHSCKKLKFSESQTEGYANEFKVGSGSGNYVSGMFTGTTGSFTDDPAPGTTYYTSNEVVPAQQNQN